MFAKYQGPRIFFLSSREKKVLLLALFLFSIRTQKFIGASPSFYSHLLQLIFPSCPIRRSNKCFPTSVHPSVYWMIDLPPLQKKNMGGLQKSFEWMKKMWPASLFFVRAQRDRHSQMLRRNQATFESHCDWKTTNHKVENARFFLQSFFLVSFSARLTFGAVCIRACALADCTVYYTQAGPASRHRKRVC